jgi:hypothetical protein
VNLKVHSLLESSVAKWSWPAGRDLGPGLFAREPTFPPKLDRHRMGHRRTCGVAEVGSIKNRNFRRHDQRRRASGTGTGASPITRTRKGSISGHRPRRFLRVQRDRTELWQLPFFSFPSTTADQKRELWLRIRRMLDFAVLGRYNILAPSNDPLVTSKNQRLRVFSNRYSSADFTPQLVEVTIDGYGLAQVTGFPVNGAVTD